MREIVSTPPSPTPPGRTVPLLPILCVVVLATFCRLFGSDFTWWDDQGTLHQNPLFNPPTLDTLRFYWSQPIFGLYVPVTDTLWAAIAKVAYVGVPDEFNVSLNPWLFHAANVGLHLASTSLVFAILRRLLAAPVPALFGAILFAVHPLQVESVAWISGMKDLLCWFGTLGVTLIYLRRLNAIDATGRPLWASWEMPIATLALALAILSKPTAIVAPAALLAIDGLVVRRRWLASFLELLPLFALSVAGAIVARVAQTVGAREQVAPWARPLVVGDAFAFYAGKFCWPFSLGIDYGRTPTLVVADGWSAVRWLAPAAVASILVWRRRSRPWLALAGAIVAIGIAPVSGIATFQMQDNSTTADHYVYFSMLGPAIALAWALRRWPARAIRVGVAVVLVALAARSFDQCGHWRDTFTLFEQAMRVNPRSLVAENNLASVQLRRQVPRLDLAELHARRAIAIQPDNHYSLQTIGVIEGRLGHPEASDAAFERLWAMSAAHRIDPQERFDVARDAFESMLAANDLDRALAWARRSVESMPASYQARADLAYVTQALATRRPATRAAATAPSR